MAFQLTDTHLEKIKQFRTDERWVGFFFELSSSLEKLLESASESDRNEDIENALAFSTKLSEELNGLLEKSEVDTFEKLATNMINAIFKKIVLSSEKSKEDYFPFAVQIANALSDSALESSSIETPEFSTDLSKLPTFSKKPVSEMTETLFFTEEGKALSGAILTSNTDIIVEPTTPDEAINSIINFYRILSKKLNALQIQHPDSQIKYDILREIERCLTNLTKLPRGEKFANETILSTLIHHTAQLLSTFIHIFMSFSPSLLQDITQYHMNATLLSSYLRTVKTIINYKNLFSALKICEAYDPAFSPADAESALEASSEGFSEEDERELDSFVETMYIKAINAKMDIEESHRSTEYSTFLTGLTAVIDITSKFNVTDTVAHPKSTPKQVESTIDSNERKLLSSIFSILRTLSNVSPEFKTLFDDLKEKSKTPISAQHSEDSLLLANTLRDIQIKADSIFQDLSTFLPPDDHDLLPYAQLSEYCLKLIELTNTANKAKELPVSVTAIPAAKDTNSIILSTFDFFTRHQETLRQLALTLDARVIDTFLQEHKRSMKTKQMTDACHASYEAILMLARKIRGASQNNEALHNDAKKFIRQLKELFSALAARTDYQPEKKNKITTPIPVPIDAVETNTTPLTKKTQGKRSILEKTLQAIDKAEREQRSSQFNEANLFWRRKTSFKQLQPTVENPTRNSHIHQPRR